MSSLKKSEFNIKFEREGGLVDLKFGEIKARDYPDFCGAVILSAVWRKSLTPLTGAELDQLNTQFYARWYSWPSVEFKGAKL